MAVTDGGVRSYGGDRAAMWRTRMLRGVRLWTRAERGLGRGEGLNASIFTGNVLDITNIKYIPQKKNVKVNST